jgi:MoxR-like ATPase
MNKNEITEILNNCNSIKPSDLIIDDLKWKYLVWAALKGKNILLLGPTRCGKTKAVKSVAKALGKEDKFFNFNIGSTQDARALLIGNSFAKKETGTVFCRSEFTRAIRTPGAIVLLDELTRGHHDAWNILMPVIDTTQRYLRIDESENSDIINVEPDVTFIATANIGSQYTATKVLDKAVSSRFPVKIEMEPIGKKDEYDLLIKHFPNADSEKRILFNIICEIADHTRKQINREDAKISNFISTGSVLEIAELVMDGFSLLEIAEATIYPEYSKDGDMDSERTYIKQLIQKYIKVSKSNVSINNPINDPTETPF